MRTFNRFCWLTLFVGILIAVMLTCAGCGSKKKLIQKTKFSTEIAKVEKVNELTEKSVVKESFTSGSSVKLIEKEAENFQAEIDDPSKKASVTKKEKDGETTWELDNIKNFNAGKEKSKEQSKDSLGQNLSKIDKSKFTKDSEIDIDAKASGSEKNIDLEVERGFPWHWVILALLIYAVISYLRNSLNPMNWLK